MDVVVPERIKVLNIVGKGIRCCGLWRVGLMEYEVLFIGLGKDIN